MIASERPEGILLTFGGQTALNCGLALDESGVLRFYQVQVLGSPISAIKETEDRKLFAERMASIDERVAPSEIAFNMDEVTVFPALFFLKTIFNYMIIIHFLISGC